ncbi:MAG: alpha amylase C-terminal domain-containing protein [Clostridia bacterium]|nr:alpha amylase C-terminal domain-containing protein [Clostridia bacterium]
MTAQKSRISSSCKSHQGISLEGANGGWGACSSALDYEWTDAEWLKYRERTVRQSDDFAYCMPLNIYRLYLGSWQTRGGRDREYLSYGEIAERLVPYIKQMGYTHVQLMGVLGIKTGVGSKASEKALYTPDPKHGSPCDLKGFVNRLHCAGIGVIAEWDIIGYVGTDGVHARSDMESVDVFGEDGRADLLDLSREETREYLILNAVYWLEKYHFDGLHVSSVERLLYPELGGELDWSIANLDSPAINGCAVELFRGLNEEIRARFGDVLMIAEESTAWSRLTDSVADGGLGFSLKWNVGWTNDLFEYVQTDPIFRKYLHGKLSYSMTSAFSEKHVLPAFRADVFGEGCSLIERQFGQLEDKFKGLRVFCMYMMSHPGKKISFMGDEYGQFSHRSPDKQLEWFMTDFDNHKSFRDFVGALNDFYLRNDEFWADDFSWNGFRWVLADESERNLLAFERRNRSGGRLLCVFNFSGVDVTDYLLTLPDDIPYPDVDGGARPSDTEWEVVFSSEDYMNSNAVRLIGGRLKVSLSQRSGIYLAPRRGMKAFAEIKTDCFRA